MRFHFFSFLVFLKITSGDQSAAKNKDTSYFFLEKKNSGLFD